MKRLICLLLALLMVVPLIACGKSNVPKGYHLVSREANPFNLYVPGTWTESTVGEIASAYYSEANRIMVSAAAYDLTGFADLDSVVKNLDEQYAKNLTEYERDGEITQTTLGGNAAYRMEYFAVMTLTDYEEPERMRFCSIIAIYDEYYVILTYCARAMNYADRLEDFDNIIANFTFKEPVITPPEVDESGKEYVLATNEKHVYKFYVPSTWTRTPGTDIPSAFHSDMSNVSLMEHVNASIESSEAYWNIYKEQYGEPMEIIATDKNAKLGKNTAFSAEYKTVVDGETYHVKQIFLLAGGVTYIMTYTSTEELYAEHLDDVAKMAELFEFK